MIPFKLALLLYFLTLTLCHDEEVDLWNYYEYWPRGSEKIFSAYNDTFRGNCKSISATILKLDLMYFFRPIKSLETGQNGMMLCVRMKYIRRNSAIINFKNVIEVYNFMAHHYVTSFPRTLKPVVPSSKSDTNSCLDWSGKITRDFENINFCMLEKSYNARTKQLTEYAGPDYYLKYSPFEEGCWFNFENDERYVFKCQCVRDDQISAKHCRDAIMTTSFACGDNQNITAKDPILSGILTPYCSITLGNEPDKVEYQIVRDTDTAEGPHLVYLPEQWCAYGRKNFKENVTYRCTQDFCNVRWYEGYEKMKSLKCQNASSIMAKLQEHCYLYYDFNVSHVGVLNEIALAIRSKVDDPYDSHYFYVIGTIRMGDHENCLDYKYGANNSKLLFFYQYRCSSDNCDNQTMVDTLKTKAEEKKLGLVCDTVNYVSENYYDYDDMHIYGLQIFNNTQREPGYICYVRVTRDKGKVNFQAGTIDTVEDLERFCNSNYEYSPSSYFNETTGTMTCCTINMKNQQSDSNCTVDNMFRRWRDKMTAKDAKSKDTSDKNVLICEKRNEKDEHCAFTGSCYSTRRIDNPHIGTPAGCTNQIDEKVLQNTAMVEYGLACLTPEAIGRCIVVNSYMNLNNTSSNESMIACCCDDEFNEQKTNDTFGKYTCDTHVDELEEDMTTKIEHFSNE